MFSKYFPREFFSNLIYQNRNYFAFSVNNLRDIFVSQNFSILASHRITLSKASTSSLEPIFPNHQPLFTNHFLLSTCTLATLKYQMLGSAMFKQA